MRSIGGLLARLGLFFLSLASSCLDLLLRQGEDFGDLRASHGATVAVWLDPASLVELGKHLFDWHLLVGRDRQQHAHSKPHRNAREQQNQIGLALARRRADRERHEVRLRRVATRRRSPPGKHHAAVECALFLGLLAGRDAALHLHHAIVDVFEVREHAVKVGDLVALAEDVLPVAKVDRVVVEPRAHVLAHVLDVGNQLPDARFKGRIFVQRIVSIAHHCSRKVHHVALLGARPFVQAIEHAEVALGPFANLVVVERNRRKHARQVVVVLLGVKVRPDLRLAPVAGVIE